MTREIWFPPGVTARDRRRDVLLTVALLAVSMFSALLFGYGHIYAAELAVTGILMCLPVLVRRTSPLLMMLGCTAASILHLVVLPWPTLVLVVVPVVSWSVARWVPGSAARWVVAVGVVGSVAGPLRWFLSPYASPSVAVAAAATSAICLALVLTPYVIGRRAFENHQTALREQRAAEERMRVEIAEREQAAKLAEASTRSVIARELHDIVAHSLSVIIVQAEGGRAAALKRPEAAQQALDTIAETGRESLREMRRIVGVLREGPSAAEFAPAPTIADIPDLVSRTTDRARLVVRGTPTPVSQTLELTVYRLVQEALTNMLKHAGPDARALVTLVHEPKLITVDVTDNGQGDGDGDGDEPTLGGGNGLRGMYERVTAMGGTLYAGPRRDAAGYRITAYLPLTPPPSPTPTGALR